MDEDRTTEWALLFPLKSGLFAMKSTSKDSRKKGTPNQGGRMQMRRGSSLSDLDKLATGVLPDLVRSTTSKNTLSTNQAKGYDSVPHSPSMSRTGLSATGSCSVRGSIGDLMNQKKYGGSSWSVRSETLIAKTVPLSTVTPKHSPPHSSHDLRVYTERLSELEKSPDEHDLPSVIQGVCPSAAQRTQKLSRLIRAQRTFAAHSPLKMRIEERMHGLSIRCADSARASTPSGHLSDLFGKIKDSGDKLISMEVCPDRELDMCQLGMINPVFSSIVWKHPESLETEISAISMAEKLINSGKIVLLHLAGRNLKKNEVLRVLKRAKRVGVQNLFCLQGDPSQILEEDDSKCELPYASDLVKFIKENFQNEFCIGVAGYPESHPKSKSIEEDMERLKEKVESGADFIITQAVFSYNKYIDFFENCVKYNINVPIVPGVYVFNSYKNLLGVSKFCKINIPQQVLDSIEPIKDNDEAQKNYGLAQAYDLVKSLFSNPNHRSFLIHIFSLNDTPTIYKLHRQLISNNIVSERPPQIKT